MHTPHPSAGRSSAGAPNAGLRFWRSLTRSPLRRAFSVAGAALGVVVWLALSPTALGGSTTYVTTYGISMEPTLHRGDLAIVRAQPAYHVGDIVAYKSESLHTTVLHRIIGRDGDRYVFKGDNNTWIDTDHPPASALIGKMEMKLSGFGTHVQQAASPTGVGALTAVAALPIAGQSRRRRRARDADARGKGTRGKGNAGKPANKTPFAFSEMRWRQIEPRLLVVTAAAVGLALLAFTRPPTTSTTSDLPFDDHGAFTYTGAAPGGAAVYQADRVSSGQPIFLNLVHDVDLGFTYDVSSAVPLVASGDVALSAQLSDTDGWTYPVDLAAPVHFDAGTATTSGTLHLDDLQAIVANMEAATGAKHDFYSLHVTASVQREVRRDFAGNVPTTGTGKSAAVAGPFVADVEFKLDATELRLAAPGGTSLTPSQGGLLSVPRQVENHFEVLGQSVSIAALRAVAIAFVLLLAAFWVDTLLRTKNADETTLIGRRYRNYLLPVRAAELVSEVRIDVDDIAALARIADYAGAPMLQGEAGVYYVVDGNRVFRYRVRGIGEPINAAPAVPARVMARPRRTEPLRAERVSGERAGVR